MTLFDLPRLRQELTKLSDRIRHDCTTAEDLSPGEWAMLALTCADVAWELEQTAARSIAGQQTLDRAEVMRQRAHRCRRYAGPGLKGVA